MNPKLIKLFFTIITIIACTAAHDQKGSVMLYGSLNYNNSKDVGSEFKANPFGVGYQFNNNVVA